MNVKKICFFSLLSGKYTYYWWGPSFPFNIGSRELRSFNVQCSKKKLSSSQFLSLFCVWELKYKSQSMMSWLQLTSLRPDNVPRRERRVEFDQIIARFISLLTAHFQVFAVIWQFVGSIKLSEMRERERKSPNNWIENWRVNETLCNQVPPLLARLFIMLCFVSYSASHHTHTHSYRSRIGCYLFD